MHVAVPDDYPQVADPDKQFAGNGRQTDPPPT
jgi:hypothetical protein